MIDAQKQVRTMQAEAYAYIHRRRPPLIIVAVNDYKQWETIVLGEGPTEDEAWQDAADRLRRQK